MMTGVEYFGIVAAIKNKQTSFSENIKNIFLV